jgi:enamine deaminase RidA (YjgF/YER057c/UK114 family)
MDAESGLSFPKKIADEIAQAFKNVDLNLRDAGGKGWSQVFRINSYHTDLTPEVTALMTENFRKWMPDHKPIWTQIGVRQLGVPDMNVELEVVAHDP